MSGPNLFGNKSLLAFMKECHSGLQETTSAVVFCMIVFGHTFGDIFYIKKLPQNVTFVSGRE